MPDVLKKQTNLGEISIPAYIISEIVRQEVNRFKGKVIITNNKGKRPSFMTRTIGSSNNANLIEVMVEEGVIDIKLFVIIRFGNSISKTVDQLIESINGRVEISTGTGVNSVSVIVTGTLSKKIAKRNIEVKKKYDID